MLWHNLQEHLLVESKMLNISTNHGWWEQGGNSDKYTNTVK